MQSEFHVLDVYRTSEGRARLVSVTRGQWAEVDLPRTYLTRACPRDAPGAIHRTVYDWHHDVTEYARPASQEEATLNGHIRPYDYWCAAHPWVCGQRVRIRGNRVDFVPGTRVPWILVTLSRDMTLFSWTPPDDPRGNTPQPPATRVFRLTLATMTLSLATPEDVARCHCIDIHWNQHAYFSLVRMADLTIGLIHNHHARHRHDVCWENLTDRGLSPGVRMDNTVRLAFRVVPLFFQLQAVLRCPPRLLAGRRSLHAIASLCKLSLCIARHIDIPTQLAQRSDRPPIPIHKYTKVTPGSWTAVHEFRMFDYSSFFINAFMALTAETQVPGLRVHCDFLAPLQAQKRAAAVGSPLRAALKLILVAEGYGAYAARSMGLFPGAPEWMVAVVDWSRETMERTEAAFVAAGGRVVYGVSDSLLVDMPHEAALQCAARMSNGTLQFVPEGPAYRRARFFSLNEYILYDAVDGSAATEVRGALFTSCTVPALVRQATLCLFVRPYDKDTHAFGVMVAVVRRAARDRRIRREDVWTSTCPSRKKFLFLKRTYALMRSPLHLMNLTRGTVDIVQFLSRYKDVVTRWWAVCGRAHSIGNIGEIRGRPGEEE